jgi:hypothetical protein
VEGEPISPEHQRPSCLGDALAHTHLVGDDDRQFFADFYGFGDVVNSVLADENSRWRLQELAKTALVGPLALEDMPSYGRRYQIFCGPQRLGVLEITNSYPYTADEKKVHASIRLEWVRLLDWETVVKFLDWCAAFIGDAGDVTNRTSIRTAMNRCLWDSLSISDEDNEGWRTTLEVKLFGRATYYFQTLQAILARNSSPRM